MVTAKVRFLTNNLVAELTCKADELKKSLEEIGVLTPLSVIKLDNARTLQIQLNPTDEVGELVCGIINPKSDTDPGVVPIYFSILCSDAKESLP